MKKVDIFSEENMVNPSFTYANFKEVGDKAGGELAGDPLLNTQANFGPQVEFLLKQDDGSHVKVSISESKQSTLAPVRNARKGDTLGFKFTEEVDSKKFPGKKAKIIKSFWIQSEANKMLPPVVEMPAAEPADDENMDF